MCLTVACLSAAGPLRRCAATARGLPFNNDEHGNEPCAPALICTPCADRPLQQPIDAPTKPEKAPEDAAPPAAPAKPAVARYGVAAAPADLHPPSMGPSSDSRRRIRAASDGKQPRARDEADAKVLSEAVVESVEVRPPSRNLDIYIRLAHTLTPQQADEADESHEDDGDGDGSGDEATRMSRMEQQRLEGTRSDAPHREAAADHEPETPAAARPTALSVAMLNLLYDPPVEGCELKPYVLLRYGVVQRGWFSRPSLLTVACAARSTARQPCRSQSLSSSGGIGGRSRCAAPPTARMPLACRCAQRPRSRPRRRRAPPDLPSSLSV
jgi:hypothetical protein